MCLTQITSHYIFSYYALIFVLIGTRKGKCMYVNMVKYEFNKRVILALTTKKFKAKGTMQL